MRVLDPASDEDVFAPLIGTYRKLAGRRGVPPDAAARRVRQRATVAAALLLQAGEADAAICGGFGDWWQHMQLRPADHPQTSQTCRASTRSPA